MDTAVTIYIDQNVVSTFASGDISLLRRGDVTYAYSSEHFSEISRHVEPLRFLDALAELRAVEVMVDIDHNGQIIDTAHLVLHDDIRARYLDHVTNITQADEHLELFRGIVAHSWGSANFDELTSSVERLPELISALLPEGEGSRTLDEAVRVSDSLLAKLSAGPRRISLTDLRASLGTYGRYFGGIDPADAIPMLWKLISEDVPDATMDQVFGKAPIDTQGYERWPRYLAAVACHGMLNTLSFHPDRGMGRSSNVAGILSDGVHMASAMFCDVLLTQDYRFWAKAKAAYAYLGAKTEVAWLKDKTP